MWERAVDLAAVLEDALARLGEALASAAPGWLALGVVLHLANQVARGRGWYAIVSHACDGTGPPRRRDAVAAWIAGAGAGGVLSARGGDAVRVYLLSRRAPDPGCAVLTGTLVAEAAGELTVGAVIVALAAYVGTGVGAGSPVGALAAAAAVALAVVALGVLARRSARVRRVARRVGRGCALLRTPRGYARHVLPWQLLSRLCRLAALACFLTAFGLPATPAAVVLIAFAQGGARLLPLAPASVGAAVVTLAATFGPVTGSAVSAADLTAFFVGMSTVLTLVGVLLAAAIGARAAAWRDLATVVRAARRRPAPAA